MSNPENLMTDAEILRWIDVINHETARETLRDYMRLRAALASQHAVEGEAVAEPDVYDGGHLRWCRMCASDGIGQNCTCGFEEWERSRSPRPAAADAGVREALAKIAEIRRQVEINVEIAKRDHPEGPIVDGKRVQGMLHSQEILAGHIKDRLAELETILAALSLAAKREQTR